MMFSNRLPHEMRPNALTELLRAKQESGAHILDLRNRIRRMRASNIQPVF